MTFTRRPTTPEDEGLLWKLFVELSAPEFALLELPPDQLLQLLVGQFRAQKQHYRNAYPAAEDVILMHGYIPIGNWIVAELPRELRLVDITLDTPYRGQGIGTALLEELLDRSRASGKEVVLHVEMNNPARRLYDRAGFVEEAEVGIYWRMRYLPEP